MYINNTLKQFLALIKSWLFNLHKDNRIQINDPYGSARIYSWEVLNSKEVNFRYGNTIIAKDFDQFMQYLGIKTTSQNISEFLTEEIYFSDKL